MKTIFLLTIFSILIISCDNENIIAIKNVRGLNKEIAENIKVDTDSIELLILKQSVREVCGTDIESQPPIDIRKDFNPDLDSSYFKNIVRENNNIPVIYFNQFKPKSNLDSLIQTIKPSRTKPKYIEFTIGGRIIAEDSVSISDFFLFDTTLIQTTRIYTLLNNIWTSKIVKENKVQLRRANSH